jgi:hypothetical protein
MRRSSTHQSYLTLFLFAIFFAILLIMGSLYTFLPSFVGLFFIYIIINFDDEEKKPFVYLCFLYLFSYELNRGFYLFSYLFTFMFFYYFFVERVRNFFSCINCILFVYILVAYIGHYFVNLFISYLLNESITPLSLWYIYYILIDTFFAVIVFKGRV